MEMVSIETTATAKICSFEGIIISLMEWNRQTITICIVEGLAEVALVYKGHLIISTMQQYTMDGLNARSKV